MTDKPDKAAHIIVTHNSKAAQIDVTTGEKLAQFDVTNRLTSRDEDAGQPTFCAEEGRDERDRKGEGKNWSDPDRAWMDSHTFPGSWSTWPEGTIGAAMNRSTNISYRRTA